LSDGPFASLSATIHEQSTVVVRCWLSLTSLKQVCIQPATAAVNVTLSALAAAAPLLLLGARRPPLSIDISHTRDARQQIRRTPLLLSVDGTDRQTDGRTPDRYIDPAPHATRTLSLRTRGQSNLTKGRIAVCTNPANVHNSKTFNLYDGTMHF